MWWNQRKASRASQGGSRSGSRTSRSSHASAMSIRGSQPRELEFQFFIRQTETLYPPWWTRESVIAWFRDLPDDTLWNCYVCFCVLLGVVWTVSELGGIYLEILDVIYNITYAIHIFAIGYKMVTELEHTDITCLTVIGFLVDLGSFAHYVQTHNPNFKLGAYYARLHRPYKYLWSLTDYNLKGSILGTTLKYCYIFMVLRITWAYVWLHVDVISSTYYQINQTKSLKAMDGETNAASQFLGAVYLINKMFIPIGPSVYPDNDVERIICLLIMMTGCLVVTGAAVASLSLIISLYMRPEETFRSRYRLIMKEMKDTQVPAILREKVETFYKMYWHKQKAVSETQLLPTFPPTLPATINIDIYFEATQKARILRELSYQILSELAKKMVTVHYIPGDAIIKRGSKKCKIIYLTYGDVEMLTAEDDSTAILRMTRGTVLTPCGGAAAAALGTSHLAVRAATFCTAHVLTAADLWRVVSKHSITQDHAGPILASFTDHIERVKRHYITKVPDEAIYKSSILQFNRNLLALKGLRDARGEPLLASADVFLEIAGCYIMRNRPDATLTDQSDEICLRPKFPCILQPTSSLLVAWNSFVAVLILIVVVVHPYHLVYLHEVSLEFRFFDYAITVVFVLDHIVYLSTGANVEEGVPITFTQTSSQQMRSHWFVLDVVGTLPIFEFVGNGHFAGINKLLFLPKLFRVLKSMEETCVYRSNVLRFCSYTLLLLIACYLIATLQQAFMCFQGGYCLVTNFTHPPFWEQKPLDEETVDARLALSLYWALSMINFSIHRETWGKENWTTVIYTLVILEICIVLRIFMEAVYSATIMVTTAPREDYGSRIEMVKNFLIRNEVDPQLRKRFITYLQLCWHTDKLTEILCRAVSFVSDDGNYSTLLINTGMMMALYYQAYKMTHKKHSNIFHDLPPHVFQDIVGRNRSKYILYIPFMRLASKENLNTVSASAKLFYTSPGEILINTGELTNEIYVIKRGICEVLDPTSHQRIRTLTTKNDFGTLICLLRLPAYYTIRAITHVQVIIVPRKTLLKVLETPQIRLAIEFLKEQPEYNRLQAKVPSFAKYEPLPPTPNMMHFRLPRKHEPDSEFLNPFNSLGFLSILRYVFPRYAIRPDGKYLLRYEWFRVTCALCSAQLFPHYTYLVLQWPKLYYVTLFLDLCAVYDIFQRMMIGYFNEDGIFVYHPSSTASYYMKGAFIVDLFGCISLENLESGTMETFGNKFRVTPTKQFLMLNRMIQLYRMPSAMMVLKEYIERRDILMVMQAIPLFMAMLNILTCFMVFYSVKIYYSVKANGDYDWLIEPLEDEGGSWLYLFRDTFRFNLTETPWNLHLATYFWVVYECSTTGYGVFNPSNPELMEVLFLGCACSTMIITYYSVRIISIRANVNNSLAGFQQHMKDINVYMAREKLDVELQKEMRRYYEYNWEKMGGIDYRGVLKLCDQITLRTDAILHIYGPTFTKCPLLKDADISLLRIVGRAVRSVYFLRDMKIIESDDMVTDMYFVDYGGVEIRVVTGEMTSIIRLPRGSVFGNLEGTECNRSPYNVVATGRLHVLMIKSVAFAHVTKDFPAIKELMAKCRAGEKKPGDKKAGDKKAGDKKAGDKKMYILGSEASVKMRRNAPTGPPPRSKKSLLKYIYFQEGVIQIYLLVICMACIYLDLYNAGYQDNSAYLIIAMYSLDMGFLLKILTQHSLPLVVTSRSIKTLMMPIRRMYFKLEFKYDLISILPLEVFSYAAPDDEQGWMWFGFLRLNRMFRIATVQKCLRRRSESITVNLTLTTVMTVSIWFSLFVHTTSCLWYFMGMVEDSIQPNSSWTHMDGGGSHCDNHYICSVYFIITTFTQNGVGDIMPKKRSEVLFVSILMILSTMVFMVYVGEFSSIIQYQSFRSFSFYSKYLELQEFMQNNRVSRNLVTIVNKYTLHLWRETRGMQVPHFLKAAPLSLRLRIMAAAYLHHITRHHIFEECEPAFLRQLVGCLKLYTYNAGMYVVKESEITDSMYVIHTGKVKETCEEMDISARVYPAGSYFGILQGLLRNTPYTHSYQTMIKSQVLTLHLDDWEYLLKHFPDSRDAIHKHMRQVGDKDMDQSNWPGGAPTLVPEAEYQPLSEITDAPELTQFPGTTRHFGRESTVEPGEADIPTPSGRRPSRFFAWPTDNRDEKPQRRETTQEELSREEEHATIEEKIKHGFFGKLASTAKKLMGRVSDTEALNELTTGKDDLLLEEDAEATEALLAQFEKAKKEAVKDVKKMKSRRKSMFHMPEEDEKHMLTLDMEGEVEEVKTKEITKTEQEPFTMRPLRIRGDDDEEAIPSPSTIDTENFINLDSKTKLPGEVSEVEVTIANTEPLQETMEIRTIQGTTDTKAAKESTGAPEKDSSGFFHLSPKSAPGTEKSQPAQVTETLQPAQAISITKVLKSPSEANEEDTQITQDIEETELAQVALSESSVDKVPKPARSHKLLHLYSETDQEIEDTRATTDATDNTDTQATQDTSDTQAGQDTQDIQSTQDIPITKAPKPSPSPKYFLSGTEANQDTQVTGAATGNTDTQATQDTSDTQVGQDTQITEAPKPVPSTHLLLPEPEGDQIIQGSKADQDTQLLPPFFFQSEPETDQDTQLPGDTRSSQVTRDSTDAQNVRDILPAQDLPITEAPKSGQPPIHPGFEVDQDTQGTRATQDTTDIQDTQSAHDFPVTGTPSPETDQNKTDNQASQDTIHSQAALGTQDTQLSTEIPPPETSKPLPLPKPLLPKPEPTQDATGTEDTQPPKDVPLPGAYKPTVPPKPEPAQDAKGTDDTQPPKDVPLPGAFKPTLAPKPLPPKPEPAQVPPQSTEDILITESEEESDTSFTDALADRTQSIAPTATTAQEAKRKASFFRRPIIFDPGHDFPDTKPAADRSSAIIFRPPADDAEQDDDAEMTEEGTSTSASKLNRRFVKVRYESGREGELDKEEDEENADTELDPSTFEMTKSKSAEESNEGDDEATTSTSTSESPASLKKEKPYKRDSD